MSDDPLFTVEPITYKGYGIGTHAIRYNPPSVKNDDGSTTLSLSFHALVAGDMLSDQEAVLQQVADVLNASEVGR